MRNITLLSVVFCILLSLAIVGCKEPEPIEPPKFTLTISPENGDDAVGEKVPITIRTEGGDSVTFRPKEKATVHSYSRPAGLTGVWEIIDTLYVNEEGLNQAYVYAFQFIEGLDDPIVKNGQSDITGHYPEIDVSANPPQISWRTKSSITITSAYGDSLVADLPGVDGKLNGTFPTPLLDSTTIFHFTLYSKRNNVTSRNITIIVDPSTKEDTLCKFGSWKKIKLEFRDSYPGALWYEVDLYPCELDDTYSYESSPTWSMTHYSGENKCFGEPDSSTGYLTLIWPILKYESGFEQEVEFLNQDTLRLLSPRIGGLERGVRETYIH